MATRFFFGFSIPMFCNSFFIFGFYPIICKWLHLVLKADEINKVNENRTQSDTRQALSASMLTQVNFPTTKKGKKMKFSPASKLSPKDQKIGVNQD